MTLGRAGDPAPDQQGDTKTMRDLVNAGLIPGLAGDPEGYVYTFDANGKAQINPASPLFRQQHRTTKPS